MTNNEYEIMIRADWLIIGFAFGFISGTLLASAVVWWFA